MQKLQITKAEYWKTVGHRIEYLFKDKEWRLDNIFLASCIPSNLMEKYNEPSFTYKSGDGSVYCWIFEFKGVVFALISGNNRGTVIETLDSKQLNIIREFVTKLTHDLKGEDVTNKRLNLKAVTNK